MILVALTRGLSNPQIGRELGISAGTVKVHLKSIFRKLGAINRVQAATWAIRNLPKATQTLRLARAAPKARRPDR
jgi:DNA-binding NarL/FixJ family response regulator